MTTKFRAKERYRFGTVQPPIVKRVCHDKGTFVHNGSCALHDTPGDWVADYTLVNEPKVWYNPYPWLTFQEAIDYECVGFLRFTKCDHVLRKLGDGDGKPLSGALIFTRSWQNQVSSHFSECEGLGCYQIVKVEEYLIFKDFLEKSGSMFDLTLESVHKDSVLEKAGPRLNTAIDAFDRLALLEMVPKLDDGFDLPVFLLEFGDVPRMFGSLARDIAKLPSTVKRLWYKPGKELSDKWLSSIFGWLPFKKDLETIIYKLFNWKNQVEKFLDDAGKRRTFHFRRGVNPYILVPSTETDWWRERKSITLAPSDFEDIGEGTVLSYASISADLVRELNVRFSATMDFEYRVPGVSRNLARVLGGLDVFGVNFDPGIIWARIPFSFVVDWVLGVGSVLRSYTRTLLDPQVVIFDYCRSLKIGYSHKTEHWLLDAIQAEGSLGISYDANPWGTSPLTLAPSVTGKGYHRLAGYPAVLDPHTGFNLRTPKGLQLLTAGALIAQRHRRH